MATLLHKQGGQFVATGTRGRGPNGRRVPANTPAYSTPADVQVGSIAGLLAAIAALGADDGGTVIEISAAALPGDITIPNNANSGSWTTNVLVRPELGTRCGVGTVFNSCGSLTLAGLDFAAEHVVGYDRCYAYQNNTAHRSGFWRCRNLDPVLVQFRAITDTCSDTFLCEWVQADWQPFYQQDFCNFGNRGPLFEGCYLAPMAVTLFDGADWTVGQTTYTNPGRPFDFYTAGTIAPGTPITIATCDSDYTYDPPRLGAVLFLDAVRDDAVTVTLSVNGVEWVTLTTEGPDYRLCYERDSAITRSFEVDDVITAEFDKAVTGVRITAGVDCTAGVPDEYSPGVHGDVFQAYASGEYSPGVPRAARDFTWRDCVIGATSTLNALFQFNPTLEGEFVWDNCFFGTAAGNNVFGNRAQPGYDFWREYVHGCDFQEIASLDSDGLLVLFSGNSYKTRTGDYTPDETNVLRDAVLRTPPPPDLAAIWPECPPS